MTLRGDGAGELAAGDLSAAVDGIALGPAEAVGGAPAAPEGGSVVIAIETSSSMLFGLLGQAQALALGLVADLDPADRVAVVAYGDDAQVVSGFSTDRATTQAAIESLSLGSFAGIYEGVNTAATLVAREGTSRRSIVMLGWGWDFGGVGTAGREGSLEAAAAAGARVFWTPLGFDFDRAYFGELTSSTGGRELTAAEFPGLGRELASPAAPTEQSFRFSTPPLPAGTRTLTVTTAAAQLEASFEVTNDGLVTIAAVTQAAPDQPFAVRLESLVPLTSLEISASAGGTALPLERSGSELRIDPYAFDAGPLEVSIIVNVNGQLATSETTTLQVPALSPQVVLEATDVEGGPGVTARWLAQGGGAHTLTVTIDGAVALETQNPEATFAVPEGGAVVATLTGADGAQLASRSLEIEASAGPGPVQPAGGDGSGSGGISTQLLAGVAIAIAAIAAVLLLVRRVRRPGRPPDFDAGTMLESLRVAVGSFMGPISGVRFGRGDADAPAEKGPAPNALVVIRDGSGEEIRVPIWGSQLSVGASRQCDITLPGDQVRFVHLILTDVGDEAYRVFRFGPVSYRESGEELADDEVIRPGEWLDVGGYLISFEESGSQPQAA